MKQKLEFPKEVLVTIREHLLSEKQKLSAQISDLSSQDPFADEDRLTDNAASDTEAKEEFNHDRVQAMVTELKQDLVDVEAALSRIEKGTYGFCVNCGKMIDTDRLAILPTATLCLDCETKRKK
jgi:DnaK suppressor protein